MEDGVRERGSLYEADFVAWTEQQAELLRAGLTNASALDYEHLLEEIEGLGRSEARAVRSYLETILLHLIRIEHAGPRQAINHWRKEIEAARSNLEQDLTPSLRARLPGEMPQAYTRAR